MQRAAFQGFKSSLGDAGTVVATAARLFARHWPVLFALALGGRAARELVMFAAVRASKINGVVGGLVFVLVPIAALVALVLMLLVLRSSLPRLRAEADAPDAAGAPRRLIDRLGSVLVPFLAVYASHGYLKKDGSEYLRRLFEDEVMANPLLVTDPSKLDVESRMPFTIGVVLTSTIAVTLVLRWLLTHWEGARQRRWTTVLGGYLEVTWIVLAARGISQFKRQWIEWLEQRRVVRWVVESWDGMLEAIRRTGRPGNAVATWLGDIVGSLDMVVVVPIAWLAVGAVIYGHELAPARLPGSPLYERAARKLSAGPRPLRRATTELADDLRGRFGPLLQGLGVILHAGLRPMLLFVLAFVIAQGAGQWLWELERLIVGPRDLVIVWSPLSLLLGAFNEGIATSLLACLLAAAVDRALSAEAPQLPESRA